MEKLPKANQALIDESHSKLYDILKGRYDNPRESLDIEQSRFHDADGRSFLRMHRFKQYGDDVTDVHYSLKYANAQKKHIEGFEEGRNFSGYRFVYPIIRNDNYLGSVEVSVSMKAIVNQLAKVFKNRSFSLIIDKKVQKKFNMNYYDYFEKLNNKEIAEKIDKREAMVESISLGENALATFLPINNIQNNFVAYLISFETNDDYVNNENQFLYQTLLSLFVIAVGSAIFYLITEHSNSIKAEKEELNLLVDARTKELKIVLEENVENYRETIFTLVKFIEERDSYTAGHTKPVAQYSELIAIELGHSKQDVKLLCEAAILHDIGKVVTPDSVLLKPASLTPSEYGVIKQHVSVGVGILSGIKQYAIKGDDIPPLARILAVADTFDAMTTNRVYKARKGVSESLRELKSLSSVHYDSIVVVAAIKALKNIRINSEAMQAKSSAVEEERVSQFYKDPLTKLFNLEYLNLVLDKNSINKQYSSANMILLKEFSDFNNTNGWEKGDEALGEISNYLLSACSNSLLFRIFGDDFVILTSNRLNIDEKNLNRRLLKCCEDKIKIEILHYNIDNDEHRLKFFGKLKREIV